MNQTNLKKATALLALGVSLFSPLHALAQGTLTDYQRAYSLQEKYSSSHIKHQAQDVRWLDDEHFSYRTRTDEGNRSILYSLTDGQWGCEVFTTDSALLHTYNANNASPKENRRRNNAQPQRTSPFRQHHRHWMETDDEQEQRVYTSQDGKLEAWIEGYNIVVHTVGRPYSEKRILTQDGTIGLYYSSHLMWSPDSKKIFAFKRNQVEKRYVYYVESSPTDQLQPILHKQEYAKPGDALPQHYPVIIDVTTGQKVEADKQLIDNQYALSPYSWTPDSREVIMEYNQRGHKLYQVLAMNAQNGSLRTIVEEKAKTFVNYSRLWRQSIHEEKELLWTSERDNWNHIYKYDIATSACKQITRGEWFVRGIQYVDEAQGIIYFSASGMNKGEDPYLVHYYKIGLDGKGLTCLTPDEGNHKVTYSKNHEWLIDTYSKVDQAPVTQLRSAKTGQLIKVLETTDITALLANGWTAPEVFTAPGRDGKTLMWGIIQRPSNFDPSKKYPVIEYIYSGPGDAYTPKDFIAYNWNMTSLAELGFIVVQLDAMGTSYRGKKFEELCYKNLKDAGFPDRMAWIKAAAQKYPYMDATNVGIFGASAGGQESTTAVLLHGDFYKAAYSSCGCHDNRMDKIWWNEQWLGYPIDSSYIEGSNVENAHKLERPLMLVVGELDDNVDPASTMQVANALIKAGKDFELVVLPGVHHSMGERYGEHKRYDFFVKNLLGVNPPKWSDLSAKKPSAEANTGYTNMSVDEFEKVIAQKDIQLVDVRTAEEFAEGHLAKAANIDVKKDDFMKLAAKQLDKNKTVAVYCRSGRRSAQAANQLKQAGYQVINMKGGFMEWSKAGKKISK